MKRTDHFLQNAMRVDETAEMLIGELIADRYRIHRVVGNGGMGVVYAATHEGLGSEVAIKLIHRDLCHDERAVLRFLHEARTASQLSHPNLVQVFDVGRLPDERPYMVMPLMSGVDLDELSEREAAKPPLEVALLLAGAAAGLDALHAQGLVHRDIKPANLFVTRDLDGRETTKVMDFGLAALERVGSRLTKAGTVVGTPEYLPPECADGTKADVRGDVYSLAVVAYELISGRLPFDSPNRVVLLADKMTLDAPLLSSVADGIRTELDEVFVDALSRDPARRPASCGELIERLQAHARTPNPAKVEVAKRKQTILGHPSTPPAAASLEAGAKPHSPKPHTPEPLSPEHSPESHSPESHSPEWHSPEWHSPEWHSPEPHSLEWHSPEWHSLEPHSLEPHSPVPQTPEPESSVIVSPELRADATPVSESMRPRTPRLQTLDAIELPTTPQRGGFLAWLVAAVVVAISVGLYFVTSP